MLAGEPLSTRTDNEFCKLKCKLSCCKTCSYCTRALTKERAKSWVSRLFYQRTQIKICEKCFLCHSIVLCKTCNKCKKCCLKSTCRGETSILLANVAGPGCRSKSSSNVERGLHPPLSDPAQSDKISNRHKLLCKSPQEPLLVRGIASAYRQKRNRTGTKPKVPGFFQPTIFSPKTQQLVETYTRSEQTKSFPQGGKIQNGDIGNHQNIPPTGGVGYANRLQGCLLPYTYTGTIKEISEISFPESDVPVQSIAVRPSTAPMEFTVVAKKVKLMAIHKGIRIHQYLDDWLVRARSHQVCLQHTRI